MSDFGITGEEILFQQQQSIDWEIENLLDQFDDSLEDIRSKYPDLIAQIQKQQKISELKDEELIYSPLEAAQLGISLDEGWNLKLTPTTDIEGQRYEVRLITPENWEISERGLYISPEGNQYSRAELERLLGVSSEEVPSFTPGEGNVEPPELEPYKTESGYDLVAMIEDIHKGNTELQDIMSQYFLQADIAEAENIYSQRLKIEDIFGDVFPQQDVEDILAYAESNPEQFAMDIYEIGRTPETEKLLTEIFEFTPEQLDQFFATEEGQTSIEQSVSEVGESWEELTTGEFTWGELGGLLLDVLKVGVTALDTYICRPWEVLLMEIGALGERTEGDKAAKSVLDAAYQEYGWTAIFSDEVASAWDARIEATAGTAGKVAAYILDFVNPIFFIPVGGTIGLAAKVASKIPILGKGLKYTAAGVKAVEKGLAYPIAKPLELGAKGFQQIGSKLGEQLANKLIKQSDNLLLEIPASDKIIEGVLVDNWMRRATQVISKIPGGKFGIEKVLGWRILVDKSGKMVSDIVGRGAVINGEIRRMGLNARSVVLQDLRAIEMNPVKYFGFDSKAFSQKMANKLLPEYAGEKSIAGTLEHVFTHPEMYNWSGMQKGLEYITRVNDINQSVLNMLKAEGVAPEHVYEDWIHRVVTGRTTPTGAELAVKGKPGVAGRAIGKKPSYEKPRTFKTMADGLAEGIKYEPNIEISVGTYIEEAFNKIANERFMKYTAEFGITPAERLLQRFPEVVEQAELTKVELADSAKLNSAINRVIRGEKLPKQTIDALEKRFPEMGRKLRILNEQPLKAESELRRLLAQNEKTIKDLTSRLKQVEKIDIEALKKEVLTTLPKEQKLREAFQVMDLEDRVAYREFMNSQRSEIQRMIYEYNAELEALIEMVSGERAARLTNLAKRKGWHRGEVSDLTIEQYTRLTRKPPIPSILTKDGKHVRWEYALDDIATELGYSSGEDLKYAIEKVIENKTKIEDYKLFIKMGEDREKQIEYIIKCLDDVDANPQFIPKAEYGMPEAGVQKDIFGYEHPYYPKGNAKMTQISMDDYNKLIETYKREGIPLPDHAVKPQVEGIKGLEAETSFKQVAYELPEIKTAAQRKAELEALRKEAKALMESKKAPYWKAKAERAAKMEIVRQPAIGEGYIMQPFAGGKIYSQEFIDAFNKFFGYDAGSKVLKVTSDAAGILRMARASLDFSQMAIQGLPAWGLAHTYLITNPKIGFQMMGAWYKAFGTSVASFFKPEVFSKYLAREEGIALNRVSFGGSSKAVDYFASLQTQGWTEKMMGKIPLKPYHRAEISFFAAGEVVRNEFWKILSKKAIASNKEFELARFLDRITGITDMAAMGIPITIRQVEQTFTWFAPNYTRACLTVLADIFRGGLTGAETRKAIGGMLAAGGVMYSAVQYAISSLNGKSDGDAWDDVLKGFCVTTDPITGETKWDLTGQFMTIQVGNYNFGFGGFWYGLLRLCGNIMECVNQVGDKEVIDLIRIIKDGSLNTKDNPFIYWWYSRSSPFFSTGFELAEGKDFLGYPIETPLDYAIYIATRFEPIWMEQGLNWMIPGLARNNEIPEGAARAAIIPAEIFGLRVFPDSEWVEFYDLANKYITQMQDDDFIAYTNPDKATEQDKKAYEVWKQGKLTWQQLTDTQRTALLSRYSDLYQAYLEAQADSALRNSTIWKDWEGVTQAAKDTYYKRGDDLVDRLKSGDITPAEFRELWSEAGQNYGIALDTIESDPHYAEIYNRFASLESEGNKYNFMMDMALSEYESIMFADYYDENGDIDWERKDEAINNFIEKWGEDVYQIIRKMYVEKKTLAGLNPVLSRLVEDKDKLGRDYWQLPYKPIYEMDETDAASGNIPDEYYDLWVEYNAIEDEALRESFLAEHPELVKNWRAEYRKTHPDIDAMLALWGYAGKIQTLEAYNLVIEWCNELGIPFDNIELGLPPRSLINNYFEYNDIVNQYGGNSIEARLYKLQNPDYLEWGIENLGWGSLENEDIKILELRVEYKDLFTLYSAYGDKNSKYYIENDIEREEARQKLYKDNPEFYKAKYTIEAYKLKIPDNMVDTYVEWYTAKPTKATDKWYEEHPNEVFYGDEWWLQDHMEFYEMMVSMELLAPIDFSKVPTKEVFELYKQYKDLPSKPQATRQEFRRQHPELDKWLVLAFGYTPISN
jgi:hypothetical protein